MPENDMSLLKEIRDDVKDLIKFQATTQERLKNGVNTFGEHSKRIDNHGKRISVQEARDCPKVVNSKIVYFMVASGFALLTFIVAFGDKVIP